MSFEALDVVGQLVAIVVDAGGWLRQWIAVGLADVKDAAPRKPTTARTPVSSGRLTTMGARIRIAFSPRRTCLPSFGQVLYPATCVASEHCAAIRSVLPKE